MYLCLHILIIFFIFKLITLYHYYKIYFATCKTIELAIPASSMVASRSESIFLGKEVTRSNCFSVFFGDLCLLLLLLFFCCCGLLLVIVSYCWGESEILDPRHAKM